MAVHTFAAKRPIIGGAERLARLPFGWAARMFL